MPNETKIQLKPEETVRQRVIRDLLELGWKENQLQWKPEWQVPDTPHDLTKRERNQKYSTCGSADLVTFADESKEWHALQVIFEFKAPTIDKGRSQLLRYLSNEPMAKMGFWTNGSQTLAVYKRHQADWLYVESAALPHPDEDLTQPPDEPPTWAKLQVPSEAELSGALKRLVATVVVGDARVTRREDQLNELVHVLLVKLESDAIARRNREKPVAFRIYGDNFTKIALTAHQVREQFKEYFSRQRTRVFNHSDRAEILFSDETLFSIVAELSPYKIFGDDVDLLSKAFQIFRTSALKSGEGQYLTPLRVIRPAVMAMEITSQDKVIDPACGTGGFLVEALRQVAAKEFTGKNENDDWDIVKWTNDNLYGIDKDDIGVKLSKALMIAMRDGSTHILLGDAVRINQWAAKYPKVSQELGSEKAPFVFEQFTVVLTNPPFGEKLKIKASDCKAANYSISKYASMKKKDTHVDLEIGLVYLELAHRLLQVGGRVGIILPETYFFSYSYRWLPDWLDGRFKLRGMLNIPMEAFEEFCRAKTNFYIFEKIGYGRDEHYNIEGV